jgi:ubiquinone/menaquinone biosynthesis C-methylase UbiE
MKNLETALQVSRDIRSLALGAIKGGASSPDARRIAIRRAARPIDYMRYAEFDAILRDLELEPHMTVLDVSSPQWLTLYLAKKYPEVEFCYINIIDCELDPYREIVKALGIKNLKYQQADVRAMEFGDQSFDRVISISVIEHVYPAEDGDLKALSEIRRVLKPEGEALLTLPYKSKSNIVYRNGPVYERNEKSRNFFAREYDQEMLSTLIEKSKLSVAGSWFISEKKGIFPVDYYEWGPGKDNLIVSNLIKWRRLLEPIFKKSLDETLAIQYLGVSQEIIDRLVNISVRLKKA